ncbi:MAG TPA: hypothetical protein DHN33_11915 [Eubacteriaceae bacterium]|nr:hypothetical protein [Eubacteriaceae bacterium]
MYFPANYSNITYESMFYDHASYTRAATTFAKDFNWDAACLLRSFETVPLGLSLATTKPETAINAAIASVVGGGFAHDILKDVYCNHPGRESPVDQESQFTIKKSILSDKEYDSFSADPLGYLSSELIPRIYESLDPEDEGKSRNALIEFGFHLNSTMNNVVDFTEKMKEAQCPPWYMALAPNPLDFLGAFLRNFDKVFMDIKRYPEKIKNICEQLAPVFVAVGKATGELSYNLTGSKRVFMPVWYNSFLSKHDYQEFHWPYIKFIGEELIKDGYTPLFSYQGEHDHLLDTILELPEGKSIAWFDRTNVTTAKTVIGEHSCIAGGISPSMLIGNTEAEVEQNVKETLAEMKSARGFIYTLPFNAIGPAKVENVQKMTETVFKYGRYE